MDKARPKNQKVTKDSLRRKILESVKRYAKLAHAKLPFIPGKSPVPVAGRVFGAEEIQALVDSSLEFWLTADHFNETFQDLLGKFLGAKYVATVNSGSSANLLAVAALLSPTLGASKLKPGDEVITTAVAFPTTVNPILLYGLVPVFVDVDLSTYNAAPEAVEAAITKKTRAIVLAHTLGNPFEADKIRKIADKHGLWLIEDCCDALGSTLHGKKVGTFGHIGTLSFFPAHHITTGEGGAVFTSDPKLSRIMESLRDWGRDCWCPPGKDNSCQKRFEHQMGKLPRGYDHKYVYSHAGFNLKITDMQAAIGCAQMARLPQFIRQRKNNFKYLKSRLAHLKDYFLLPSATAGSDPAWFGFPVTIQSSARFSREDLLRFLNARKIGTRLFFAGNIIKQPYFEGRIFRASGALANSDAVMARSFWIGVYPGLTKPMLDYAVAEIEKFVRGICG
jgi:CDP-6-deoxy-D-xylo-4-hexulose-3-dehydrase